MIFFWSFKIFSHAAINWCQRIVEICQINPIYFSWAISGTSFFAVDQQLAIYKRVHFYEKNCQNINNVRAVFRLAQYLGYVSYHSLSHK